MPHIDPTIFRAYDIRGIVDKSLTEDAVRLIGQALGSEARERGENAIVVGRDGRLSGERIVAALTEGLTTAGLDVIDVGQVPTPVVYFAAAELRETYSGVAVTGSHNPPDYNGLKMVLAGTTLAGEAVQDLRTRIESGRLHTATMRGIRKGLDCTDAYLRRITEDVQLLRPLKVVVDCGNGVAGAIAPRLLRALGCEVTELYCEVDGTFPNHHPDPTKPENVRDLIATVRERGADLGLGFDGDGDRLGVVTPDGVIVWPDRLLMLWAQDVLDRNPGAKIIYDIKCSMHVGDAIRRAGGEPVLWKTGHSLIKAKLKETGALLAGEMSGHIFFKERWYGFDDALYAAARLLEILSKDDRSPAAVFHDLPDSVNTPELNVCMEEGETFAFMDRLTQTGDFGAGRLITIDGLRVEFDDGWGLVRSSNTTPCLVIRFEADDEAALARIQGLFRDQLHRTKPDLELPF